MRDSAASGTDVDRTCPRVPPAALGFVMSVIRLFRSSRHPFDAGRDALRLSRRRGEVIAWATPAGVILVTPTDELSVVLRRRRRVGRGAGAVKP